MRLLIADDSAAIRERLAEMLAGVEGLELQGQAEDASMAWASIGELRPELVILDIQMPGGSGIDLLREVKKHYPATITIMLTNYPYPQYHQRCAELGADYFLCKSTDARLLIEIVERLVRDQRNINEQN